MLPSGSKVPKWTWISIKFTPGDEDDDPPLENKDSRDLLGRDRPYEGAETFDKNTLRSRSLTKTIVVYNRDTYLVDGSKPNQSVIAMTRGAIEHDLRGPLLAMAIRKGRPSDPVSYRDLEIGDVRDIVDFFITAYANESVKGVRVNCNADVEVLALKKYQQVKISRKSQIFDGKGPGIPRRVGLPVLTYKLNPDPAWKDGPGAGYENQEATCLHFNDNPIHDEKASMINDMLAWGFGPRSWQESVGSVLVVREDRKDLAMSDAEALCRFCREKMAPLFEKATDEGWSREAVDAEMTPEKYRAFKEELRQAKATSQMSI